MSAPSPQAGNGNTGRLGLGRLAMFASASIPVSALATPLSVYIPNYYASHLGLSLAAVGSVFFVVRMIDIFFDPLIGVAINATQTRLGRFRPWMILGVPILMAGVFAIYMAEPGVTTGSLIVWLLVLYAGFSILTLGHAAWAAALVPEYHGRSRIYGWMQAVGVAGLVIVLMMPSFAPSAAAGIHWMGYFILVATPLTVLLCVSSGREPRRTESHATVTLADYWTMLARPSLLRVLGADLFLALGPAITGALYLFFFEQALGYTRKQTGLLLVIYIAAGLIGAPFWAQIARYLGKHRTVMLACVLYGFAQALVFVLPKATMLVMIPGMFFAGFVVSAFTFLIRAMVADVGDEVRLDIGKDRTALLYGLITSTSKVGSTISIGITFSILAIFGFNAKEGAMNIGMPLDALVASYVVVPVLTMFVGAAMLMGYRLDAKRHDEIRATLAERDVAIEGAVGAAESLGGPILAPLTEPGE
jgi:GPH family glycoside/pentoside/hexuronide:cation symporter